MVPKITCMKANFSFFYCLLCVCIQRVGTNKITQLYPHGHKQIVLTLYLNKICFCMLLKQNLLCVEGRSSSRHLENDNSGNICTLAITILKQ